MMKKTVSLLFFLALSLCGLAQEQHVVVLTEAGTLQQKVAEAGLEQAESLTVVGPINSDDVFYLMYQRTFFDPCCIILTCRGPVL